MTKNTPKKPAVMARTTSFPASFLGESERRSSAYMAGIAETNNIPRPPAAVDYELDYMFCNERGLLPVAVD